VLGYPEDALKDANQAVWNARVIGNAVTLMFALTFAVVTLSCCGDYAAANALADELVALAHEKGAAYWKAAGTALKGDLFALTGKSSDAVHMLSSAIQGLRSAGSVLFSPVHLSYLTGAYVDLGQHDDAWRCVNDAVTAINASGERWFEAEVHRSAGEAAVGLPEHDTVQAETYLDKALSVARAQQAKSWELRAAMSLARLWRDQGKVQEARELLAPIYGWFTEGFDTRDLKEAKALLDELA
jgi:predicted ATPase